MAILELACVSGSWDAKSDIEAMRVSRMTGYFAV